MDRKYLPRRNLAMGWGLSNFEVINYAYIWTITNFSQSTKELGESFTSPDFYAAKTPWFIRCYPRGVNRDSKDYLVLTLNCSSDYDVPLNKGKFKFSIVNSNVEKVETMESGINKGFQYQVKRDILLAAGSNLLPDNKLTIYCKLTIVKESVKQSGLFDLFELEVPECSLLEDIKDLLVSEKFSDVTITAGDRVFKVHKPILTARSQMFDAMFRSNLEESQTNNINVTNVEPDVLQEVLKYLYTGKSVLQSNNNNQQQQSTDQPEVDQNGVKKLTIEKKREKQCFAIKLLQAADLYQLDRLKVICEVALDKSLTVSSVVEILVLADLCNANDLKSRAIEFIAQHANLVKKTDDWKRMIKENQELAMEVLDAIFSKIASSK